MIKEKNILLIIIAVLLFSIPGMAYCTGKSCCSAQPSEISCSKDQKSISAASPAISFFSEIQQEAGSLYNGFNGLEKRYRLLLIVLSFLIISVISLFLAIMINRTIKTNRRAHAAHMKKVYQEELTSYLFEEDTKIEFTNISNPLNREFFINELLSLHNNLYGESATKLRELYFSLGLNKDSLRKVNSSLWHKKAKGFREVAQMDVKEAIDVIAANINSRNKILRMEAQVAMVKLAEKDPLNFLDDLKSELSLWEQVNILNTLDYHQITVDSFERWLTSSNISVLRFAAKMTGVYKQSESAPSLVVLLNHPDAAVRLSAIEALGQLEAPGHIEDIHKFYLREIPPASDENDNLSNLDLLRNRKAAVKAMLPIVSQKDMEMISIMLENETDIEIMLLLAELMVSTRDGLKQLNSLYFSASENLRKIIENINQTQEK
jgi:hypothetical protein